MKRWQDRGEVQDSDDEDLSLGNDESQSPEQARKRPRLDDGPIAAVTDGGVTPTEPAHDDIQDEEADEPWLQPKVATTYSRKVRAVEIGLKEATSRSSEERIESHVEALASSPLRAGEASQSAHSESDHGLGLSSRPELADAFAGPESSQSSDSNELPSASQLLFGRLGRRGDGPAREQLPDRSASSSPLTEREVSPPPGFNLPGAGARVGTFGATAQVPVDEDGGINDGIFAAEILQSETLAAAGGRRQLRARKEKQLHPYQHDKTLFAQQWRQRGLRPVHYTVRDLEGGETQDQTYSGDESESQQRSGNHSSSPARPSSELGASLPAATAAGNHVGVQPSDDEEEFPDIDSVINRTLPGGIQDGRKRRKVFHLPRAGLAKHSEAPSVPLQRERSQLDNFSVPPSPPPTSSDSAKHVRPKTLPAGFKLPGGMTPAPLPTPDVSSDLRPPRALDTNDDSDSESLPRRSRPSTVSRPSLRPILIESLTESESDSAPEPEVDQRRLLRERKRIRGVLPASWLKIDFRAQQRKTSPSPPRSPRIGTASPPPSTRPLKGVAQRVPRGFATSSTAQPITISDDGEDSDDAPATRLSQPLRQPRLQLAAESVARNETVDGDLMEVDWVDPMLAGSSRGQIRPNKGKKRQPRIKDAFARIREGRNDFSEERAGLRHTQGPTKTRKRRAADQTRQPRRPKPRASALSILDAPSTPTSTRVQVPQFVRLAQRLARRQTGQGRHTPTRKVIRLATKDDTDEATAVLRAWREGTIAPRAILSAREPLAEINDNRQARLPPPVRRETNAASSGPGRSIVVRRSKPRQTQLQPMILNRQTQEDDDAADTFYMPLRSDAETRSKPSTRRFNVQPQGKRLRGAQIETLENTFDQEHRTSAFERRIHCLTETVAARARRAGTQALPLERFLDNGPNLVAAPASAGRERPSRAEAAEDGPQPRARTSLPYRPRKRRPQHVDAEARHYRQPSEPLPEVISIDPPHAEVHENAGPILRGLGPFGTKYAVDFDIQPLPLGTYFHQSTFIGSGDFAASLKIADRDLSIATGRMRVHVGDEVFDWGAWTEEVATSLARIPITICEALLTLSDATSSSQRDEQLALVTSNIDHMLRSIVRYCSRCVAFLDPVDRRSCVQHLQRFVEDLVEVVAEQQTSHSACRRLYGRCLQYALVVATHVHQLCHDDLVQSEVKLRGHKLMSETAQKLARHLIPLGLDEVRAFYEDNRHSSKREAGIRDDDGVIAGIVIMHHCLRTVNLYETTFWSIANEAFDIDVGALDTVSAIDRRWYDLYTLIPALEFDPGGIARPGSRLRDIQHDWTMIKRLVDRVFELYAATAAVRGSTINDYVRANFTRCYRLISRWGWWKCEAILGTIFDSFARRGLAQLHNEESRGSPKFLEELSAQPSLEAQPEDRSFHLFLKMLAVGLQGMQKQGRYSDKKIGGIAWRFIPNHGRTYRKDADVRQTDLDALRNHHDLLCTLYYASPPGHRLRLDLLRNLVDHSTSHREACRLSVRSWANLASFQASIDEPAEALQPFTEWFQDVLQTTMTQYRLAKTEAEHDFAIAKAQGATGITESVLTATITSNQRQIAATLVDALAGLKLALQAAKGLPAAIALVEKSRFWTIFTPFDATERRLYIALDEALNAIKIALEVQRKYGADVESQQASEESQDYGDSSALQAFAATQSPGTSPQAAVADLLHDPIGQLLSNVIGADQTVDDATLTKLVDIWVRLASESVRSGKRSWASYLDDYSSHSWRQLRDTDQRRKFTPYFLACVVKYAGVDIQDVRRGVLTSWLVSLVDREVMLKYQHELTAALLNRLGDEPLLGNPPFSKDSRTGAFSISLHELRQRRLALISSVLCSMRENFDECLYHRPQRLPELRRTCTEMLKSVMQAMKSNYLDLQNSTSTSAADPNVHGAYVEFVQHVVSYMQEHTADICRVDPFFTDSSAFPLPATDPTYVVGRLKRYVAKLAESKTRMQLAVFIHSVSERAAVDGQQQYLVDQLCSAMEVVLERGSNAAPSLRHVVLTAIFPAYIESALSTACSWILALPLLQACNRILGGLLYNIKLEDAASVKGVVETMNAVLRSMHKPLELAVTHPGLLRLPHVQKVLGHIFDSGQSLLTLCDYLGRSIGRAEAVAVSLHSLEMRGLAVSAHLKRSQEDIFDPVAHTDEAQSTSWADTRAFAQTHVKDAFNSGWHAHDGQYFVKRGNGSKEVVVALKDEDEEQETMLASIEKFCKSYETIVEGQARVRRAAVRDGWSVGGVMV